MDDNDADAELFRAALRALRSPCELLWAGGGEEALARLKQSRSPRDLPAIILLDLHMTKMNGFEVLSAIRAQPGLRKIPVIVLSGSSEPGDVRRAYELGANSYLRKSPDNFFDLVGDFDRYWLRRAELPTNQ